MLANAHFQLQQEAEPGLLFKDCYLYGMSTANQRIKAWWQQLSKGYLFRWRVQRLAESASAFLHLRVLSAHGLSPRLVSILSGPHEPGFHYIQYISPLNRAWRLRSSTQTLTLLRKALCTATENVAFDRLISHWLFPFPCKYCPTDPRTAAPKRKFRG